MEIALGIVRHALGAVGASLVTAGLIDESTSQQLIGAVMTLAAFGASAWVKWRAA